LQYFAVFCNILQYFAVIFSILQYFLEKRSILQFFLEKLQYFAVFFRKNAVFCSKIVKKSFFFEFFTVVLLEFEYQLPQNEDVILLDLVSVISLRSISQTITLIKNYYSIFRNYIYPLRKKVLFSTNQNEIFPKKKFV
jgi:hypothetical protein